MLINKIKDTIKKYNLISPGDRVLAGVSGGPDSMALLCILHKLSKELGFSIYAAHLDHMLRKDSAKDRGFVEDFCRRVGIVFYSTQINVQELSQKGSLEEIARNARFGFFFNLAKKIKAKKIALGHNLDDQAETVLMRIIRGAGLYGLSAILPKRQIAGFYIIRPLIEIKRKEIEAFLKRKSIKPRIDKSNFQDIYFRNKIRNSLLPLLEKKYNCNIKAVLSSLAETAGYDYDYLNKNAEKALKLLGKTINKDKYNRLHPAIQRLVLRLSFSRIKGDTRGITYKHIKEIEDMIFGRPLGSVVDLPKGVSVVKKKNSIVFFKR
ncbi:MAG: tRNA lysidine(34) synthetase TilS [Candidatus Omnitrophota bacterium]